MSNRFICDAGSWELVLTNDKRERFHYEGTLCTDFNWQGKSVSDRLRSILDWPDLWAFALHWRKKPMRAARPMTRIR